MGILKRDPEKIRHNAAELIGDGEEIRALTMDLTQENFWKKETVELADFINSRSTVSPTSEVEA